MKIRPMMSNVRGVMRVGSCVVKAMGSLIKAEAHYRYAALGSAIKDATATIGAACPLSVAAWYFMVSVRQEKSL